MRTADSRILVVLAAMLASILLLPAHVLAQGCAMCGTAFTKDDPVTRAFSWSVLFLIAMPYTLFALADPTRRAILDLLTAGERPARDLVHRSA